MQQIAIEQGGLATKEDGLSGSKLIFGVLAISLATALSMLDSVIANIALPTITKTLNISPSDSVWIVNAYQLSIIMTLLPLSSLGDRVGYARIYIAGLVLFTFASLMCAMSQSLDMLIISRVLQGLGAAGIGSVNTAIIKMIYPSRLLGRGVSIHASVVSISTAAGPTIAAAILSIATWPWLFAINVPLGIVTFFVGFKALPRPQVSKASYDYFSALLNAAMFGLLVIGVDRMGHSNGINASIVIQLSAAAICAWLLVRRERHRAKPLLPVDLLLKPAFLLAVLTSVCSFTAQMLAFVSLPFMLQDALGRSAMETGALITPWPIAVLCIAPLAGSLSNRINAGALGGVGLAILATGLSLLALLPAHPASFDIGWRMAVCGIGFGLFQPPNNRSLLALAPPGRTGNASGMISVARVLGQTFGAVLTAFILLIEPHHAGVVALITGASFAAVAACVSLTRLI
ncbi:MFS transporter [Paraburkholderia sp. Ac-20336]|uniref:MFS transporter n=1 Tax=Burkholderiaceae TaxID=119060 RepID=UPI0014243A73|nr:MULTISPECIES: MFS transporter [Burkholderiaceae]MBN3802640.1 MFS transporter [Paraburkholderia sp. Ac-20336]MBN3846656.1 MFS transporter [Paraburkholderia sp. Ac-20342]NIF51917.1 MFS transporter [Burkholderia sp. Ax-1724]NIF78422.1 MFS transporter [Paraburkholderia sp. Cy-641]